MYLSLYLRLSVTHRGTWPLVFRQFSLLLFLFSHCCYRMTEFLTGFLGKKTFRDSYGEIICRPDALADAVTTKQLREKNI